MISRLWVQLVAGVTAAIGVIISVVYSGTGNASLALKVYSYSTSVCILVLLLYEHYMWSWLIVRRFTDTPDLRGTWKGELQSSYLRDGQPIAPIATIIRITQTASTQKVTLFTVESTSVTELSNLIRESDGRWRLSWTYANKPRALVRHRSDCHLGTAEVTYDVKDGLVGSYYTDRLTRGELRFPIRSKKLYTSVVGAEAEAEAGNFTAPS